MGKTHLYRSTAKHEFGVTDRELDSLQCRTVSNPNYRSGPPARLYARADVEALAATEAVINRLARKAELAATREARKCQRESRIECRYGSWQKALPDACAAMFNLNRYAKHESCRKDHRAEIYDLKNRLVEVLYRNGYCVECVAHERALEQQWCFRCHGTGLWEDWNTGDTENCRKCNGTGTYLPARTVRDIAFKFDIEGRSYAWHQPSDLITFSYVTKETLPGKPAQEKPVEMSAEKMRDGKVIIRYVLREAAKGI